MMPSTAIIVEDVELLAEQLHDLVEKHCPEIKIIDIAHTPVIAEDKINTLKPDLVFMDIELPGMNAFELLGSYLTNPLTSYLSLRSAIMLFNPSIIIPFII